MNALQYMALCYKAALYQVKNGGDPNYPSDESDRNSFHGYNSPAGAICEQKTPELQKVSLDNGDFCSRGVFCKSGCCVSSVQWDATVLSTCKPKAAEHKPCDLGLYNWGYTFWCPCEEGLICQRIGFNTILGCCTKPNTANTCT